MKKKTFSHSPTSAKAFANVSAAMIKAYFPAYFPSITIKKKLISSKA